MDEVVHSHDTADVTTVVAEEDTTKGGKGAHHVGLESNGGLDAGDVGRAVRNCTSSHFEGGFGDVASVGCCMRQATMRESSWQFVDMTCREE